MNEEKPLIKQGDSFVYFTNDGGNTGTLGVVVFHAEGDVFMNPAALHAMALYEFASANLPEIMKWYAERHPESVVPMGSMKVN